MRVKIIGENETDIILDKELLPKEFRSKKTGYHAFSIIELDGERFMVNVLMINLDKKVEPEKKEQPLPTLRFTGYKGYEIVGEKK